MERGFTCEIIETHFKFDTLEKAEKLMTFYFGHKAIRGNIKLEYGYKVAAYSKRFTQ